MSKLDKYNKFKEFIYDVGRVKGIRLIRHDNPNDEGEGGIIIDYNNIATLDLRLMTEFGLRLQVGGKSQILQLHALSQAYYNGPKILKLDGMDFAFLENTDINLCLSDYSQPFPTMVIEFPDQYSREKMIIDPSWGSQHKTVEFLGEEYTMKGATSPELMPEVGIVHFNKETQCLVIAIFFSNETVYSYLAEMLDETIEVQMGKSRGHTYKKSLEISEEEVERNIVLMRVCLNACLFLDQYGVKARAPTPADTGKIERLRRQANSPSKVGKANADRAARDLRMMPTYYDFAQKIKLGRVAAAHESVTGMETGRRVRPHWRRGHWRTQRHGPGLTLRKRIHVEAVFVNAAELGPEADLSKTEVTYHVD